MTKDSKIKIAAGAATVGAAVLGGIAGGPFIAAAAGLYALGQFMLGVQHTAPTRQLKLPLDGPPPPPK